MHQRHWLVLLGLSLAGCDGDVRSPTEVARSVPESEISFLEREIERSRKPGSLNDDLLREYMKEHGEPRDELEETLEAIAKGENLPRVNTGGGGVVTGETPKGFAKDRRDDLARVRKILPNLREHSTTTAADPHVRQSQLLALGILVQHWNYSAEELEVAEKERVQRMQEARTLAIPLAKRLWQECRGARDTQTLSKANELLGLLALVRPEEIGTTSREAATLIVDVQHRYIYEGYEGR
jgi:hypothetical protein